MKRILIFLFSLMSCKAIGQWVDRGPVDDPPGKSFTLISLVIAIVLYLLGLLIFYTSNKTKAATTFAGILFLVASICMLPVIIWLARIALAILVIGIVVVIIIIAVISIFSN